MWNFAYHNNKTKRVHNLQEATIMNEIARSPQIFSILDDLQADHQAKMVEIEGKMFTKSASILIDLGFGQSYVSC